MVAQIPFFTNVIKKAPLKCFNMKQSSKTLHIETIYRLTDLIFFATIKDMTLS